MDKDKYRLPYRGRSKGNLSPLYGESNSNKSKSPRKINLSKIEKETMIKNDPIIGEDLEEIWEPY